MNKRIEELAKQAGFQIPKDEHNGHIHHHAIERFAKLIVKECSQVASDWVNEPTMLSIGTKIKYHFGVEQ